LLSTTNGLKQKTEAEVPNGKGSTVGEPYQVRFQETPEAARRKLAPRQASVGRNIFEKKKGFLRRLKTQKVKCEATDVKAKEPNRMGVSACKRISSPDSREVGKRLLRQNEYIKRTGFEHHSKAKLELIRETGRRHAAATHRERGRKV